MNITSTNDDADDFFDFVQGVLSPVPVINPNAVSNTQIVQSTLNKYPILPTTVRKGWPARHCRRQGWYRFHIIRIFQILARPNADNVLNPSAKPWSIHEIEVFEEIRQKLATLYNNRYEEYYKMITEEKELEYFPRNKINSFILK